MDPAPQDYRTTGLKLLLAALLVPLAVGVWWWRDRSERRLQQAANERNATAILRVLAKAEEDFRLNDRDGNGVQDYWTADVAGLHRFTAPGGDSGRKELIDRRYAEADGTKAHSTPHYGYFFKSIEADRSKKGFAFCAYPADPGRSGRWTFMISEAGQLYRVDTGGKPVERWAPDPETWKLLD